jgi:hypothetical protein
MYFQVNFGSSRLFCVIRYNKTRCQGYSTNEFEASTPANDGGMDAGFFSAAYLRQGVPPGTAPVIGQKRPWARDYRGIAMREIREKEEARKEEAAGESSSSSSSGAGAKRKSSAMVEVDFRGRRQNTNANGNAGGPDGDPFKKSGSDRNLNVIAANAGPHRLPNAANSNHAKRSSFLEWPDGSNLSSGGGGTGRFVQTFHELGALWVSMKR